MMENIGSENNHGSTDAIKKKNYFQELAECGVFQKWKFEVRRDGMHSKIITCDAFLKLWSCGVTGFIPGIHIPCPVDIFGSWTRTGICLNFLSRKISNNIIDSSAIFVGHNKCEGRWAEGGIESLVEEGRVSHMGGKLLSRRFQEQTVGTFKMSLITGVQEVSVDKDHGKFVENLRSHMRSAPESQHFYDFKIECQDGAIVNCHKIVLISQTKYFEGLFRQEQADSNKVKIQFAGDVVKRCIHYLYTGNVNIDGENVQDTLVAANYLLLNDVVSICVSFILSNMDLCNCIDILNFGENYGIIEIVRKATKMLSCNFQTVFMNNVANLKRIPLHLFKSVITSDFIEMRNEYNISMQDEDLKLSLDPVIKQFWELNGLDENIGKDITEEVNKKDYTLKKFCPSKMKFPVTFGNPGGDGRKISSFDVRGNGEKYIRKIDIYTNTWDGRTVIGCLNLYWSDGATIPLGRREGADLAASYDVPDGEHISVVIGYAGWYVDNLTFILSNGTMLDAVGGDGGRFRNSVARMHGTQNIFNIFLDGIKGDVMESQGVSLLSRVQFQYGYIGDETGETFNGWFAYQGDGNWANEYEYCSNDDDDDEGDEDDYDEDDYDNYDDNDNYNDNDFI